MSLHSCDKLTARLYLTRRIIAIFTGIARL